MQVLRVGMRMVCPYIMVFGSRAHIPEGKALRTVKSCVGSSWCRYGIGDSVGREYNLVDDTRLRVARHSIDTRAVAIQLEQRYKGIRSPHKFKGGVSGCVRECAEAQGKDFGLIATDKGWNSESTHLISNFSLTVSLLDQSMCVEMQVR